MNWFQGTGMGQKVNGQQVRLLLWSPSGRLSPPKRTELPLVFQTSSPVFSAPQQDKKHRACQKQGSVFTSSMRFQTSKKITQNQSENRRGLTSQGQLRGEEMDSTLLSRVLEVPGTRLVHTLGIHRPQHDILTKGTCDPR